jgi:hypothetical protein
LATLAFDEGREVGIDNLELQLCLWCPLAKQPEVDHLPGWIDRRIWRPTIARIYAMLFLIILFIMWILLNKIGMGRLRYEPRTKALKGRAIRLAPAA